MAIPSYLTLAIFKERLGITSATATQDLILTSCLEAAGSAVNTYLGYSPQAGTLTEYHDTGAVQTLSLKRWPVVSVEHVYEDVDSYYGQGTDPFPASSELVQGVDYVLSTDNGNQLGVLYRIGRYWPWAVTRGMNRLANSTGPRFGSVKVEYTVDNTAVLSAATQAAYAEAASLWQSQQTGQGFVLNDSMDGASVGVSQMQRMTQAGDSSDSFLSPLAAQLLRPYKRARLV